MNTFTDPSQSLFDAIEVERVAGRMTVPMWRDFVLAVRKVDPEFENAAIEVGTTSGLIGPDDDIEAILSGQASGAAPERP